MLICYKHPQKMALIENKMLNRYHKNVGIKYEHITLMQNIHIVRTYLVWYFFMFSNQIIYQLRNDHVYIERKQ